MPGKDRSPHTHGPNPASFFRKNLDRRPNRPAPRQAPEPPAWETGTPGVPALPGGKCLTPPHPDWLPSEKWAWERICRGEAADFVFRGGFGYPDPRRVRQWLSPEGEKRLDESLRPLVRKLKRSRHENQYLKFVKDKEIREEGFIQSVVGVNEKVMAEAFPESHNNKAAKEILKELEALRETEPGELPRDLWFLDEELVKGVHTPRVAAKVEDLWRLLSPDGKKRIIKAIQKGILRKIRERWQSFLPSRFDPEEPETVLSEKARERVIRPEFIRMVLLHEPWRSALTSFGFRIYGAFVPGNIDLYFANVECFFWLWACRMQGDWNLQGAEFRHNVDIGNNCLSGKLNLARAEIGGGLFMHDQARFLGEVSMHSARVDGQVVMNGSRFDQKLILEHAEIGGGLFMRDKARFLGEVNMTGARVGGQVEMQGSRFDQKLILESAEIGGGLFMHDKARFLGEVNMHSARVGGQVAMDGSRFDQKLILDNAEIGGSLFMHDKARFLGEVNMHGARVGGQVAMDGSNFEEELIMPLAEMQSFFARGTNFSKYTDLLRCKVTGFVILEAVAVEKKLRLVDVQAGGIYLGWQEGESGKGGKEWRDSSFADLALDGFKYEHVLYVPDGRKEEYRAKPLTAIDKDYLLSFLACQREFSPQPYEHMAGLLRRAGQPGRANSILAAGKRRARRVVSPVRAFLQRLAPPKDRQPVTYRYLVRREIFEHFLKRFDIYGEPSKPKLLTWLKRCLLGGGHRPRPGLALFVFRGLGAGLYNPGGCAGPGEPLPGWPGLVAALRLQRGQVHSLCGSC